MWSYSTDIDLNSLSSESKPVLIIKHSNRCSISAMALNRLLSEEEKLNNIFAVYLIDVVQNRDLSQQVASHFAVEHESPQVLLVQGGKAVYNASHLAIQPKELYSVV